MKTVILTLALATLLIAVAVLAMGVKVFFKRGGRFPSGHICHNPEITKRTGSRHTHTIKNLE